MLGKLLARWTPRTDDPTDPEVIEHYRREAEARRRTVEHQRTLSERVSGALLAARDRNHFGPDIDLAFHLNRKGRHP